VRGLLGGLRALRRCADDGQADPPRYAGIEIARRVAPSGTALALAPAMHTPRPSRVNQRHRASRSAWKNLLRYRTPIVGLRQAVAPVVVGRRITAATVVPQKPALNACDRGACNGPPLALQKRDDNEIAAEREDAQSI